jgi:hypothetical protein
MDDKTNLALTLILSFVIGLMLGVGGRVTEESHGREIKTGDSDVIDLILLVFSAMALGYMLAIVWHVKLFSLVFVVIAASTLVGISRGSKLALERNQTLVRVILFGLGLLIPMVFHFLLS